MEITFQCVKRMHFGVQLLKKIYAKLFVKETEDPMKYLVIGLGNMGAEYEGSRHNVGFDVVDQMRLDGLGPDYEHEHLGDMSVVKHRGRTIHLLKPSTFMNRSGKAVRYWVQKKKIQPDNLLIVVDDIHLPLGQIRLRIKGGDGGHNGLKDIHEMLGTQRFARLRIGIGRDFYEGQQVNYVLGQWKDEEKEILKNTIVEAQKCIQSFVSIGAHRTMNQFNSR